MQIPVATQIYMKIQNFANTLKNSLVAVLQEFSPPSLIPQGNHLPDFFCNRLLVCSRTLYK